MAFKPLHVHLSMLLGGGGRSSTMGGRSPGCFFGVYLGEAFQSQTNTEKILYNESLGTDML